jgi:hypothetical protein
MYFGFLLWHLNSLIKQWHRASIKTSPFFDDTQGSNKIRVAKGFHNITQTWSVHFRECCSGKTGHHKLTLRNVNQAWQ